MKKRVIFASGLVKLIFWFCGGLRVAGQENVPSTGRLLVCPNHISDFDPPAVLATLTRADFATMGKEELFRVPFLGWLIRAYGTFPVARDSADRKALRQAEAILDNDRALLLFPEGRVSQEGTTQKMQSGAAMLALRTHAPVLPVGLIGTNRVLPYGKLLPRHTGQPAEVRYGKPILVDEFADMPHKEGIKALTARIGAEIAMLTGQPASEEENPPRRDAPLAPPLPTREGEDR